MGIWTSWRMTAGRLQRLSAAQAPAPRLAATAVAPPRSSLVFWLGYCRAPSCWPAVPGVLRLQATEPESPPVGLLLYTGSFKTLSHALSSPAEAHAASAQPPAAPSQPPIAATPLGAPPTEAASLGIQAFTDISGGGFLPPSDQAPVQLTGQTGGSAEEAGTATAPPLLHADAPADSAPAAQAAAAIPAGGSTQDGSLSLRLTGGLSDQTRDTPQPQLPAATGHAAAEPAAPAIGQPTLSTVAPSQDPSTLSASFAPVSATPADVPAAAQQQQQAGGAAPDSQVQPATGLLALARPAMQATAGEAAAPAMPSSVSAAADHGISRPQHQQVSPTHDIRSLDLPAAPWHCLNHRGDCMAIASLLRHACATVLLAAGCWPA